jgi:hypothetical protein
MIPSEFAAFLRESADGQTLHFDPAKFVAFMGYADTPANRDVACRAMVNAAREKWPEIELTEVRIVELPIVPLDAPGRN